MKRISAGTTVISKKIFPVLWACVFVGVFVGGVLEGKQASNLSIFLPPVLALLFGLALWWGLASDLADEVFDCGDYLLIRRGRSQDRIYLANIMNVDSSFNVNPPRLTLHLVRPCQFGRTVSFSPIGGSLNPFAKNPLVGELIQRAYEARTRRPA